jgi:nucleotide-binding universal stress UspA family protein
MEYRTILVHVDASAHAPGRIRMAAQVAARCGAHLVGVACTGVSRFVCPEGDACAPGSIIAGYLQPVYDAARQALEQFEHEARAAGLARFSTRLAFDQPDEALARLGAYADLVVLSQNDPDESTSDFVTDLPAYVILNCARPVLLVPRAGPPAQAAKRVLVAWDGSKEASVALTGAIPLLRGADDSFIVRYAPPERATPGIDHEADLLAWLARHQVRAGFLTRPGAPEDDGALLSLARELQCDLLVMGCYGHTRFRELLLGGASRMVLQSATIPVLMAH